MSTVNQELADEVIQLIATFSKLRGSESASVYAYQAGYQTAIITGLAGQVTSEATTAFLLKERDWLRRQIDVHRALPGANRTLK